MVKYCACGCGTVISDDKTWVHGHNTRVNNPGKNPSKKTREKLSISIKEYFEDPLNHEKASEGHIRQWENPLIRKKTEEAQKKRWEDPLEREKQTERTKKYFGSLDDPGEQIVWHHYIYDFNDLTKYVIPVTRSEHLTIHNNLRHTGLEVPCINIMVDD